MITSTDMANILYRDAAALGFPAVAQEGNVPQGPLSGERVVVHYRPLTTETVWNKSFAEVNFLVPDTPQGNADLRRLNALERLAWRRFKAAGKYDGTVYRYAVASTAVYENRDLKAHYVNAKVLFKAMNVLEPGG